MPLFECCLANAVVSFDNMPSVCFYFLCIKKIHLRLRMVESQHCLNLFPTFNQVLLSIDKNSNVETRQYERRKLVACL